MTKHRRKAFRTMFIGLGGTGDQIIRRVKREMLHHHFDLPIFQYLVLDTMPFYEKDNLHPLMHLRNGEEYLYIGGYNPNEILKQINNWPVISHWWGTRDPTNLVTVDEGAGQMRSVGRMGFFRNFTVIQSRLELMVREVMSNSNREMAITRNYDVPVSKPPVIYIVFSLCGGTGSSLFFDVAYVLRKLFFNVKPTIVGLAMLPGPYIQEIQSIPQRDRIQANTYAALQELERLHSMALGQEPRVNGKDIWDVQYATNFRVTSADLPFDYIYLVDDTTTTGEYYTREQTYDLMSQVIFWLAGPSTSAQFWERAKNLSSNTLAGGGRPDAAGRLRLPRYSSFGVSHAMLNWNTERIRRELELLIVQHIRSASPVKPSLPNWLGDAHLLINKITDEPGVNPIPEPDAFKPSGQFKDRGYVDETLESYTVKYNATLKSLPHSPKWLRWRERYQKQSIAEVNTLVQHSLVERGPLATSYEIETLKEALEEVHKKLSELEGISSKEASVLHDEYEKSKRLPQHEVNLVTVLRACWGVMKKIYGAQNKATARALNLTAKELAHQRYLWYAESFRTFLCRETAKYILEPAILHLERVRSSLLDIDDALYDWQLQIQQSLPSSTSMSTQFETTIRVMPQTSEHAIVHEAVKLGHIRFDAMLSKILTNAYSTWPKQGSNAIQDLRHALPQAIDQALLRLGGQAHILDILLEPASWKEREMFLRRAECLWSFSEDASQEVMSHLEYINIFGYEEGNNAAPQAQHTQHIQSQIDELLKQQNVKLERVATDIPDELVYIKTSHGLMISLIRSMPELHHAYQVLNVVRAAPYLHLDYRDQVRAGYTSLASLEMTHQQVIESWTEVANSFDQSMQAMASTLKAIVAKYKLQTQSHLQEVIQVQDEHDPIFEFANAVTGYITTQNRTAAISEALVKLSDLTGLLHAQGWAVISPAIGAPYDPVLHDKIDTKEDVSVPDNSILEVIENGYIRRRPGRPIQVYRAKVIVSASYDIEKQITQLLP